MIIIVRIVRLDVLFGDMSEINLKRLILFFFDE